MLTLSVKTIALPKALKNLKAYDTIAGKWMKVGNQTAVEDASRAWRSAAPVLSGRYRGGISGKIKKAAGINVVGVVGTGVTNKGYAYARLLEFSKKHTYKVGGRPTRLHAKKAVNSVAKSSNKMFMKLLGKIAKDIEG